jgi:exopolysaccharide production protein ExoZ
MSQILPMPSSKQNTGEIPSIQYLRGIAAVSVIYFHTGVNSANLAWPSYIPRDFGKAGVDVFFVISGFIMVFVTSTRETSPRAFLLRRIIRVVPLYWFFTLLIIFDGLIYPAAMLNNAIAWPHIFLSLLFIPHINPITGSTEPFFKLGWTLIYEMYFYAVFALLLLVRPISKRMILMVVWAAGAALVFELTKPVHAIPLVYTNPIILEFVLGALIGHAYVNGKLRRFSSTFGWLLVVSSAAVIIFTPFPDDAEFMYRSIMRPIIYGIPAALIVCGLLGVDSSGGLRKLPWLMLIGDASYSIYLSHTTTLTMFRVITRVLHVPVQNPSVGATLVLAAVVCAIFMGIVVFRYVELPLMSRLKRLLDRNRAASARP